jgi:hypothetical protein
MNQKGRKRGSSIFMVFTALIMVATLLGTSSFPAFAATEPVRVPADVEWVSTGIFVEEGQTIYLVTHGLVITGTPNIYKGSKSGPDGQVWNLGCGQYEGAPPPCAMNDAPYGALVGRVGPFGEPFLIGGASSFVAPASGNLYLTVNDNLGFYSDNLSGFTVLFGK